MIDSFRNSVGYDFEDRAKFIRLHFGVTPERAIEFMSLCAVFRYEAAQADYSNTALLKRIEKTKFRLKTMDEHEANFCEHYTFFDRGAVVANVLCDDIIDSGGAFADAFAIAELGTAIHPSFADTVRDLRMRRELLLLQGMPYNDVYRKAFQDADALFCAQITGIEALEQYRERLKNPDDMLDDLAEDDVFKYAGLCDHHTSASERLEHYHFDITERVFQRPKPRDNVIRLEFPAPGNS